MKVEWAPLREVLIASPRPAKVAGTSIYPSAGLLNRGRGLFRKPDLLGSDTSYKTLYELAEGDVVYSKLFGWEGSVAVVPSSFSEHFVSSEFPVFRISSDDLSRAFLGQYLRSGVFTNAIANATTGLGQRRQRVNVADFLSLPIPLPPRAEQDRIATYLDAVETAIERARERQPAGSITDALPRMLGDLLRAQSLPLVPLSALCANRQQVIHPGDDLKGAASFVGLEHIQSHTGIASEGRPVGEESGRKLRFEPGQVTYGYLRPYLNKAWAADRVGLCSVEQFVLQPSPQVAAELLSTVLRSDLVLAPARDATNSLQLPRLRLGALLSFDVPDIRHADTDSVARHGRELTQQVVEAARLEQRRQTLTDAILPAARNAVFAAMQ